MHKIKVKVMAREFVPGTSRPEEWEELMVFEVEVATKYAIFMQCQKQFGRCRGLLQDCFGYQFEGKNRADDGSFTWWETRVIILEGAKPLPGFDLG